MKPRDYCCCAIPIVNVGIYATLAEQLVLGLVVGILSLATPHIVGAATPSAARWITAILCFAAAGIQVLGFIGVANENSILYRRYVTLHIMTTVAVFATALTWTIISASRHSTAQDKCEQDFFQGTDNAATSEGEILCNIFPWVDVGLMGGLLIFFAITQIYFYLVVSSYGSGQRRDHEKYDALGSPVHLNSSIPMTNRGEAWDSRPSDDALANDRHGYGHTPGDSSGSVAAVLNDKLHQPSDGYSNAVYSGYDQTYPPVRQMSSDQAYANAPLPHRTAPSYPEGAYTQEPVPTPGYSNDFYGGPSANLERPPRSQTHPGES